MMWVVVRRSLGSKIVPFLFIFLNVFSQKNLKAQGSVAEGGGHGVSAIRVHDVGSA